MKVKELIKTEVCYFCFDTKFIPAKAAGLNFDKKYGYARMLNQEAHLGFSSGYYLCGIYDYFTDTIVKDINEIKKHDFIMNQKFCFPPDLRGEYKWIFIGSEPMSVLNIPDELPHITNSSRYKNEDIVTYGRNGVYVPGMGHLFHTEYKNVKHLEGTEIITPNNIIFDLYTELLKQTRIPYTDEELWEKMLLITLPSELVGYSESRKQRIFRDFKHLFEGPIYKDIPRKYREKSISVVDNLIEFDYKMKAKPNKNLTKCIVTFELPSHYQYETVSLQVIMKGMPEIIVYDKVIDKGITRDEIEIDAWEEGFYVFTLLIDGYIKDTSRLHIP